MAKKKIASQESLSDILYRFSVAISAIKVAKEALDSPRLDTAIVDQALTLAIDGIDDAYDMFDAAIVRTAHSKARKAHAEVAHG
jgi:hypothetical protein